MKTQQFLRTKSANNNFIRIIALGLNKQINTVILFLEPGLDEHQNLPLNKIAHAVYPSELPSSFRFIVKLINDLPELLPKDLILLNLPGCLCRTIYLN